MIEYEAANDVFYEAVAYGYYTSESSHLLGLYSYKSKNILAGIDYSSPRTVIRSELQMQ